MRENSRRDARSPRGASPAAAGHGARSRAVGAGDAPASGSGGRGARAGAWRAGNGGARPGPAGRGASQEPAEVARLTSMIEPILAAMNLDIETVKVATVGRRRLLRIVVDADGGVSLDDIALASREVSARLDAKNAMGDAPYTLEVTSPGVDRPLTEPRHWRRAAGRLVAVQLTGQDRDSERDAPAGQVPAQARVIGADEDGVTLEMGGTRRTFGYAELGPGRVQVEFGRLDEIDDCGDVGEPGDRADEEDRNGH
jgi:ribosome maturation factor RimP